MRKTYEEGINRLLTQLSVAQKYAEDGDYEKAHAAAAELRSLMKEYHHKLDV
ncbi:cytochrome b562 [Vibrio sp. PP-XX7]